MNLTPTLLVGVKKKKKIDDRKQRGRTLTARGEVSESDTGMLECCPEVMDLDTIWAEERCGVARLGPSWAEWVSEVEHEGLTCGAAIKRTVGNWGC